MNILVTGANGQLGNEMRIVAQDSGDNYIFTDVSEAQGTHYLDITDGEAIRSFVAGHGIDVVVNCAAYTNVEAAETNAALAMRLNALAPQLLARAVNEAGGLLVHVSTDYVFGGDPYNTPCTEAQQGKPIGVYGSTKFEGEKNIQKAGGKYVILRTAWLYSEFGKNFCKTMMALTADKPELKVVFDQAGTPTYALDLARAIVAIVKDYNKEATAATYSKTGIYHYSNEGVCSWFDFTKMIAHYCGHTVCRILPCHSDEFKSAVTRPAYSVLDKTKVKQTFGIEIPYWTDSLQVCINNLLKP